MIVDTYAVVFEMAPLLGEGCTVIADVANDRSSSIDGRANEFFGAAE
jgi:hypothetical protein